MFLGYQCEKGVWLFDIPNTSSFERSHVTKISKYSIRQLTNFKIDFLFKQLEYQESLTPFWLYYKRRAYE